MNHEHRQSALAEHLRHTVQATAESLAPTITLHGDAEYGGGPELLQVDPTEYS